MSEAAPVVRSRLTSHEALCDALRDYLAGAGITFAAMDAVARLGDGHTQKILGAKPKRIPNFHDMLNLIGSCGLALDLVEVPEMVERRRMLIERRCMLDRWSPAQRELYRQQDRLRPEFFRIAGQAGGLARARELSAKLRQEIARKAGIASGRARRRKS